MKGVVLSGGSGTRLRPITHTNAKQLIPIANKPILFYVLEDVKNAGITEVAIIVGHTKNEVIAAVGDGSKFGLKVTYFEQDAPRGIAHAVSLCEEFAAGDSFVTYLGDNLLQGGINDLVKNFNRSKGAATIALSHVKNPQRFGVAELDAAGNVVKLVEKPKEPKTDLALVGIYVFSKKIFDAIRTLKPSWRNELEITEAIDHLVQTGEKVDAHVVGGWWKDTGKPEDVLDANRLVLEKLEPKNEGLVEKGAKIIGRVSIGKGTVVKHGTEITGPAIIGENCTIGPDAKIGENTAIGDGCHISNCTLENTILLGSATIRSAKKIKDSILGRHVLVDSPDASGSHRLILGEHSQVTL